MLETPVDGAIASTLSSKFHVLQPSQVNTTARLLPLVDILRKNQTITKLVFPPNTQSGNNEANILGMIMSENTCIREIWISNNNMDIDGLASLCGGIKDHNIVTHLDFSNNFVGPEAVPYLVSLVETMDNLEYLDVSNMNIAWEGVQKLRDTIAARVQKGGKAVVLGFEGNFT